MELTDYQRSLVEEFESGVAQCETLEELMHAGVNLFTINYVDTIIKACWPSFAARLRQIAPEDFGKLVIAVDLPAIFHAAFSVIEGEAAVEDTISRIDSAVETIAETCGKTQYTTIITADSSVSWRKQACHEFKSKRKPKPDGFKELLEATKIAVEKRYTKIAVFEGMESDDVMASVAFRCKLRRHQCVLLTDDRDLLQCVGNGVSCFSMRGATWKNEDWLLKEMQLTPKQIVDYLCLVGKDDIPSAHKIGEVTATKLLVRCGTFWGIIDSLDDLLKAKEVTAKQADSLQEYTNKYLVARRLHTKLRNLEIHW